MAFINKETNEKIDFKANIKLYLKLAAKYKLVFISILILAVILEIARIVDKFLFKVVIDNSSNFLGESLLLSDFTQVLIYVVVAFIISLIVKVLVHYAQSRRINRFDAKIMYDLKKKFFDHIVHLSHNFHTTHKTGSLISRMTRGSRSVEGISNFIFYNLAVLVIQIILVGGSLIYFDPLSAIIIVITSVIFISWGFFLSFRQQKAQRIANRTEDLERGTMADMFTNIDSIKYFGKEDAIKNRFSNLSTDTQRKIIKFWDYQTYFRIVNTLILGIGTLLLFYFPLVKLMNGEMDVGTVAFIYTVYLGLMGPLFGFVHGVRNFYVALGDLDSLSEYSKIHNEILDKDNAPKLVVREGDIEFKDISFGYGSSRKVIDDVNLKINPGEKVALVGHSGSGKTTLVKLLYRFYDISDGGIYIDGKNIKRFNQESLRGELSIVPQEAVLFDDTIYNNVRFSNPRASKGKIMEAIKFAQLDKFLKDLPLKEKTIVGERGVKLSGGEKQRVSIARALLANKKILVLDEATSALDSKTENEIQRALEGLMEGRTSIIIAHRLSTIMGADKIVVMDKGKIVQIGKHDDLIKKSGVYQELWNLQKGGYIEE
jgi:ATP-binding cassette subfamily B protein